MSVKYGVLKIICLYMICLAIMVLLLVAAAYVPRESIKHNMLKSSEYISQRDILYHMKEGEDSSLYHGFADMVILSIGYSFNEKHPLLSVMESKYYNGGSEDINKWLLTSVKGDLPANEEYTRYWHGSAGIIRCLHLIFSIKEIYVVHAIVLLVLYSILNGLLLKGHCITEALSLFIALAMVNIWFVPFCLEYYWCFEIMLSFSAITVYLAINGYYPTVIYLVIGMITAYLDFLSTETVTLLIPLLLALQIKSVHNSNWYDDLSYTMKASIFWLTGYAGMWASKWIMAAWILKRDIMTNVTGHISQRLGEDIGISKFEYYTGAILNNIKKLLPFGGGLWGTCVFTILTFLVTLTVFMGYVDIRNSVDIRRILLYTAIGLVPYIRYIALHNHSYLHSFFTYRAQVASVLALCLVISELIEFHPSKRSVCVK